MNKVTRRTDYWMGLSTEDKPSTGLHNGDEAYEVDTKQWYVWYNGAWYPASAQMHWN
jgi:hypothetical protein